MLGAAFYSRINGFFKALPRIWFFVLFWRLLSWWFRHEGTFDVPKV